MHILKNKHRVESFNGSNSVEKKQGSHCSGSKLDSIIKSSSGVFEAYDVPVTAAREETREQGIG